MDPYAAGYFSDTHRRIQGGDFFQLPKLRETPMTKEEAGLLTVGEHLESKPRGWGWTWLSGSDKTLENIKAAREKFQTFFKNSGNELTKSPNIERLYSLKEQVEEVRDGISELFNEIAATIEFRDKNDPHLMDYKNGQSLLAIELGTANKMIEAVTKKIDAQKGEEFFEGNALLIPESLSRLPPLIAHLLEKPEERIIDRQDLYLVQFGKKIWIQIKPGIFCEYTSKEIAVVIGGEAEHLPKALREITLEKQKPLETESVRQACERIHAWAEGLSLLREGAVLSNIQQSVTLVVAAPPCPGTDYQYTPLKVPSERLRKSEEVPFLRQQLACMLHGRVEKDFKFEEGTLLHKISEIKELDEFIAFFLVWRDNTAGQHKEEMDRLGRLDPIAFHENREVTLQTAYEVLETKKLSSNPVAIEALNYLTHQFNFIRTSKKEPKYYKLAFDTFKATVDFLENPKLDEVKKKHQALGGEKSPLTLCRCIRTYFAIQNEQVATTTLSLLNRVEEFTPPHTIIDLGKEQGFFWDEEELVTLQPRKKVEQEAKWLLRLADSGYVPKIHGYFQVRGGEYRLVTSYVKGVNLEERMQGPEKLHKPEVLFLMRELWKIVAVIHAKRGVWGDFSLSDLIYDPEEPRLTLLSPRSIVEGEIGTPYGEELSSFLPYDLVTKDTPSSSQQSDLGVIANLCYQIALRNIGIFHEKCPWTYGEKVVYEPLPQTWGLETRRFMFDVDSFLRDAIVSDPTDRPQPYAMVEKIEEFMKKYERNPKGWW